MWATSFDSDSVKINMPWKVTKIKDFEDEEKRGVITMASEQDLLVVGLTGWSGTARVYDLNSGEFKFILKSNYLDDTPAPFSHDNVLVWINSQNIFTLGMNDNSFIIWDLEGNLLAKDLHKNADAHEELARIKAMDEEQFKAFVESKTAGMDEGAVMQYVMSIKFGVVMTDRKLQSLSLRSNGKIYTGTANELLTISKDGENWKITNEVDLGYGFNELESDGDRMLTGKREEGQMVLKFWDEENGKVLEDGENLSLNRFSGMKLVYPYVFTYGGPGNSDEVKGVKIYNIQTGELVRHLLKGEKEYMTFDTNGEFIVMCEEIHSWTSGEEIDLKLAVYSIEQLVDQTIEEENLWSFSSMYSVKNMGGERITACFNKNKLIINHGTTKFSVFEIEEN